MKKALVLLAVGSCIALLATGLFALGTVQGIGPAKRVSSFPTPLLSQNQNYPLKLFPDPEIALLAQGFLPVDTPPEEQIVACGKTGTAEWRS